MHVCMCCRAGIFVLSAGCSFLFAYLSADVKILQSEESAIAAAYLTENRAHLFNRMRHLQTRYV